MSPQQLEAARAQGAVLQAAKGNDPITGAPYTPPPVQEPWYDRAAHFLSDRVMKPAPSILVTSPGLLEYGLARTVASATEAEFAIGASRAGLSAELQAELELIPAMPARGVPGYSQRSSSPTRRRRWRQRRPRSTRSTRSPPELLIAATKQPFEVAGVGKNALGGVHEATVVAHGVVDGTGGAQLVDLAANLSLDPKQMAEYLVKEAGWSGGTLRLSACGTGIPNANGVVYGEQLAKELAALDAPTVVLAPQGQVAMSTSTGLPLVVELGAEPPPGKGWAIFE